VAALLCVERGCAAYSALWLGSLRPETRGWGADPFPSIRNGSQTDSDHSQTKLCRSPPVSASQVVFQILFAAPNRRKGHEMAAQMTKSQLIEKIAATNELAKKDVKGVLETLADVGYKELKKTGVFLVPGFAKFVVIKKPATKARQGTNPFNGEPMMFKAKPARKIVRARPVKAAKDAV
jgi:nucleoid DNA-binding protein